MPDRPPPPIWESNSAATLNAATLAHACGQDRVALYGLIDAAVDPTLYARLLQEPKTSEVTCLFDGDPKRQYGAVAPWLLTITTESHLVYDWLSWGWRRNWGIWLAARQPIARVKTHLKKFLFIARPDGRTYFRYYDPRVLPQAMQLFTDAQRAEFFGLEGSVHIQSWFTVSSPLANGQVSLIGYRAAQKLLDKLAGVSNVDEQRWPWNTTGQIS